MKNLLNDHRKSYGHFIKSALSLNIEWPTPYNKDIFLYLISSDHDVCLAEKQRILNHVSSMTPQNLLEFIQHLEKKDAARDNQLAFHYAKELSGNISPKSLKSMLLLVIDQYIEGNYDQSAHLLKKLAEFMPETACLWQYLSSALSRKSHIYHQYHVLTAEERDGREIWEKWLESLNNCNKQDSHVYQLLTVSLGELLKVGMATFFKEKIEKHQLYHHLPYLYASLKCIEFGSTSYLSTIPYAHHQAVIDIIHLVLPEFLEAEVLEKIEV